MSATRVFELLGHYTNQSLMGLGQSARLVGTSLGRSFRRPARLGVFGYQLLQVGLRSLPLCIAMSAFSGMVLSFQFGVGLERFGAKLYIGQVTVTALFRELGPILTALVVGARVGAGIAAELGGMIVTEQVDAVRALGANPLTELVAPRIVACTLALPLLAVVANVVGVAGAMLIAALQYGVPTGQFLSGVYDFVTIGDFSSGLTKAVVFGLIVGTIACHQGMRTRGGTEGVGRAATFTVVDISLWCLGADFILTKLMVNL